MSGHFFVLSAPSGAGKTSLIQAAMAQDARLKFSISATTRTPRAHEKHGEHYFFHTPQEFQQHVQDNAMLEHAQVFHHWYGTPKAHVHNLTQQGHDVICDVDWQGARSIRQTWSGLLTTVFILPPSLPALAQRLATRGQDSDEVIHQRLQKALEDISHWHEYDAVIVNDDFDNALQTLHKHLQHARWHALERNHAHQLVITWLKNNSCL